MKINQLQKYLYLSIIFSICCDRLISSAIQQTTSSGQPSASGSRISFHSLFEITMTSLAAPAEEFQPGFLETVEAQIRRIFLVSTSENVRWDLGFTLTSFVSSV
jgi:hypothetical protein